MNRKQTLQALEEISDKHIAGTQAPPKKKRAYWLSAVAAALAVAVCVGVFAGPVSLRAKAVALPGDARILPYPDRDDYKDTQAWQAAREQYQAEKNQRAEQVNAALSGLSGFFAQGTQVFLSGQENQIWSPVNAYIGLAAVSELTGGESRRQILELLGAADLDTLRRQASAVWESAYCGEKHERSSLANALWLEEGLEYDQTTMENLAHYYYASVYRGDLGSGEMNRAIATWLDENTGGYYGLLAALFAHLHGSFHSGAPV